jgi:hypothetical protein
MPLVRIKNPGTFPKLAMWPSGHGWRSSASNPARARRSPAGEGRGEGLGFTRSRFGQELGGQEAADGSGRQHQAAAAAGTAFPARMLALPSNPRLWRLWWRVVVASVCTTGHPMAWRGELTVGGHGGAVAACGAGRRGRTREAAWLP